MATVVSTRAALDPVLCPHALAQGQLRRLDNTHFERWLVCSECCAPVRRLDVVLRTRKANGEDCFTVT